LAFGCIPWRAKPSLSAMRRLGSSHWRPPSRYPDDERSCGPKTRCRTEEPASRYHETRTKLPLRRFEFRFRSNSILSRNRKLAMTCRLRISSDSAVNASRLSAHCIHWLSSCHVSITAENAIAPSPFCFGRIVKRGVRIGIGTSIRTGSVIAMLHDTRAERWLWPHDKGWFERTDVLAGIKVLDSCERSIVMSGQCAATGKALSCRSAWIRQPVSSRMYNLEITAARTMRTCPASHL
jgi:hypothetical protein